MANPREKDPKWQRYEIVNSVIIWLIVGFMAVLVVYTSYDYSRSPATFTLFGQNQLFLLGFITFLLLFRYIRKIKIGEIIDVELGEPIKRVDALINETGRLATKGALSAQETQNEITGIRDQLLIIKGSMETIKAKAVQTT